MKHNEKMLVVFEQVKLSNNENYIKQLYQLTRERFDREYLDFINEFLEFLVYNTAKTYDS